MLLIEIADGFDHVGTFGSRDVEAVEYFLLPLPLRIKLVASDSSFFLQSASASTKI